MKATLLTSTGRINLFLIAIIIDFKNKIILLIIIIMYFSIAGHQAVIGNMPINLYPASKFALRAMTETLKGEIRAKNDKIRITVSYDVLFFFFNNNLWNIFFSKKGIHPGVVKTDLYQALPEKITDIIYNTMSYLESKDVADCVMFALSMPSNVQVSKSVDLCL